MTCRKNTGKKSHCIFNLKQTRKIVCVDLRQRPFVHTHMRACPRAHTHTRIHVRTHGGHQFYKKLNGIQNTVQHINCGWQN